MMAKGLISDLNVWMYCESTSEMLVDFQSLTIYLTALLVFILSYDAFLRYSLFSNKQDKKARASLENDPCPPRVVKRVIGCRMPDSAPGTWTGAFVGVETDKRTINAMFIDRKDYVGDSNWPEIERVYAGLLGEGWKPMTREDIRKTSGV